MKTFDDEFLIHSDPKDAAASLLSEEIRQLLTGLAGRTLAGFTYEKDAVVLQLVGVELDPTAIMAAVRAVGLAAGWKR